MASRPRSTRSLVTALAFLAPNILGVLAFVVFPLVFSVMLAFTNWDLRLHNMYKEEPLEFVGLRNFVLLLTQSEFLRFLGNTLFLMMGIPFSIAGSLMAAILLSKDTRGGGGRVMLWLGAASVLVISVALLAAIGLGGSAMVILLVGVACTILVLGMAGGVTAYRTLFYMPHFTAGVATFLLWKKLYNPTTGPINQALQPVLDHVAVGVTAAPATLVQLLLWIGYALILLVLWWCLSRFVRMWRDGDIGTSSLLGGGFFLLIPLVVTALWDTLGPLSAEYVDQIRDVRGVTLIETTLLPAKVVFLLAAAAVVVTWAIRAVARGQEFAAKPSEGMGSALVLGMGVMVLEFVLLGLSAVALYLPWMAANPADPGLTAPAWIADYSWAKPSLMIMGLWGAIGSNNMLLYLAALTNVPQDLYEAADIDGASPLQRFWHVTWPQLAPTTFFIAVMSTIGGLQGGFEMARTMTEGGPAGATTTLSYFVYTEGFETGRLSFAAATAWVLFLLVFALTMFNWRFGNRYVNE